MEENVKGRFGGAYNPNRFNALDSALSYICVLAAFFAVSLLIPKFFKQFFVSLYEYDYYAFSLVNILISQAIVFTVALIWTKSRRADAFDGGGYRAKFDGVQILMSIVLIMGVMMTFYYVHIQLSDDADALLGYYDTNINSSDIWAVYFLIYVFFASVIPAFAEEMLFRGVIMRGLEQYGKLPAVILSAVMFSLMHGSFSQTLLQFIGGLAIAGVVILTKNWLLGTLMHFTNNVFAYFHAVIISDALAEEFPALSYLPYVTDAACIISGVVFLIVSL